jgi:hypothetical protein
MKRAVIVEVMIGNAGKCQDAIDALTRAIAGRPVGGDDMLLIDARSIIRGIKEKYDRGDYRDA